MSILRANRLEDLNGNLWTHQQQVNSVESLRTSSFTTDVSTLWLSGYYGVGTAGGGLLYRDSADTVSADNGGTVFVDGDGVRWKRTIEGAVYVSWFGAKGDGETDDAAAINSACSFVGTNDGGEVLFESLTYLVSETISVNGGTISRRNVSLRGSGRAGLTQGVAGTIIKGTGLSGPVILVSSDFSNISDLVVDSSEDRTAQGGADGHGILIEPPDVSGSIFVAEYKIENVSCLRQPGVGLCLSGASRRARINGVLCRQNKSHGLWVSHGQATNRTNLATNGNGMIDLQVVTCDHNEGHGAVVGDPGNSTRAFRVLFRTLEASDNGTNSAAVFSDHQLYLKGDELELHMSALRGSLGSGNYSKGVYLEGRNNRIINTRFVDTTNCVDFGVSGIGDPEGNVIDGARVFSINGPQHNPSFLVPNFASGTYIRVTVTPGNHVNWLRDEGVGTIFVRNGAKQANKITSITGAVSGYSSFGSAEASGGVEDDSAVFFNIRTNNPNDDSSGAIVLFWANISSAPSGMVWVRSRNSPHCAVITSSNQDALATQTGPLTGTTGADGKITISVDEDGNFYLENRAGAVRNYGFTVLK